MVMDPDDSMAIYDDENEEDDDDEETTYGQGQAAEESLEVTMNDISWRSDPDVFSVTGKMVSLPFSLSVVFTRGSLTPLFQLSSASIRSETIQASADEYPSRRFVDEQPFPTNSLALLSIGQPPITPSFSSPETSNLLQIRSPSRSTSIQTEICPCNEEGASGGRSDEA